MPETIPVNIRVADIPQMKRFTGSVANLLRALAMCDGLPSAVMSAADEVRLAVAAFGGTGEASGHHHQSPMRTASGRR